MSDYYHEVYEKGDPTPEGPHGWIQWKGTQPCIDLHCKCGYHGHVDHSFFFYYYQCPSCKQKYALGQNIVLIPLTEEHLKLYAQNPWSKNEEPDFVTCALEEEM